MGNLTLEVPHSLRQEEAQQRITALVDYWHRRYGFQRTWAGTECQLHGSFMGVQLKAEICILEDKISGTATDPGFLLRKPAHKYLTQKMAEYLNPRQQLEEILRQET
jgi:hypothetical protein